MSLNFNLPVRKRYWCHVGFRLALPLWSRGIHVIYGRFKQAHETQDAGRREDDACQEQPKEKAIDNLGDPLPLVIMDTERIVTWVVYVITMRVHGSRAGMMHVQA